MNHLFIHEKRFAAAALALLARYSPQSFACGLDFAAGNGVPPWTLITLLHVLLEFEVEPYTASRATAPTLRSIAIGELVSARVLATALLERAGLPAPTAHPSGVPLLSRVADHRADELAHLLGEERIERINRVWPDFGIHAIGQMDAVFRSEDMRRRMGRALDHFRLGRKGCRLARWFPIDEEAERVLQITGSAVRCALAQGGVLDASAETEVGMRLLGDTETMVRLVLSRTTRPTYAERLRSKGVGLHVADLTVDDCGEFADWVVVGFREMESKISGHDSIDARVTAYAGVVFTREWEGCRALPFGRGDSRVWSAGSYREVPEDPLRGPLAALQDVIDPFGGVKLFVPHPLILVAGRLDSAPFDSGLTLIDQDDQPAVVCRIWRRRLIGTEYFDDREHRIDGLELLVRPDVFSAVSNFSSTPPRLVTLIVEHPEG